jgi:hypothetical protein
MPHHGVGVRSRLNRGFARASLQLFRLRVRVLENVVELYWIFWSPSYIMECGVEGARKMYEGVDRVSDNYRCYGYTNEQCCVAGDNPGTTRGRDNPGTGQPGDGTTRGRTGSSPIIQQLRQKPSL